MMLNFFNHEHEILVKEHRYTQKEGSFNRSSLYIDTVSEVQRRLEKNLIDKEMFLRLLRMGADSDSGKRTTFRVFKPYNPFVIDFIKKHKLYED